MPSNGNALHELEVASPCDQSWEAMKGGDRARYCEKCELFVYNLSGMSLEDAEELVSRTEGRLCVRFFRRSDGTVLTRDCPRGFRAARRKLLVLAGTGTAALATLATCATMAAPGLRGVEPFASVLRWFQRTDRSRPQRKDEKRHREYLGALMPSRTSKTTSKKKG